MQKKRYFLMLFIMIASFLFTSFSMNIKAKNEEEKKIIRVGYPIQEGLTDIDENGNYTGYSYEYLQEIAQYSNWEYEFVTLDKDIDESLTEMIDMLEKGKIDIMGGMVYSEKMAEQFDYAGRNYGNAYTVLKVPYDSDITNLNAANRTELRVAVIKNAKQRQKELNEFCELNMITPILIECESSEIALAAIENGTADAMLDVSAVPTPELRTIASFAPRPFYFITTKGRTDIISEVNSAIDLIEQTDPFYATNLYNKYFGNNDSVFKLTSDEEAFIKNSSTIKVGVLLNNPPFQYQDSSGELNGINIDFLDYIADKSGLKFEYVTAQTQKELDTLINENKIDVVSNFICDYSVARNNNVALTKAFIQTQSFVVMKKGTEQSNLKNKTYVDYSSQLTEVDSKKNIHADTLHDALNLIDNGKADYTLGDGYTLQYYTNQSEYSDLVLLPYSTNNYGIGFGIVRPVNKDLLSIFNKVIINIGESELQNIIYPNTTYNREFSIQEWIRLNPFTAVAAITLVMVIIILLLTYTLQIKKRMNNKISQDLGKRQQIYELANDYFFEYNEENKTLMISVGTNGELKPVIYRLDKLNNLDYLVRASIQKFVSQIQNLPEGTVEIEVMKQNGEMIWLSITGKTFYENNGKQAYIIGKINNIQEEKKREKRLLREAELDGLTQIYNANTFRNKIKNRISQFDTTQKGVFLLIDADNFKGVNDSFGHLQGDKALISIGKLLYQKIGETGICGRLGGDEFVLYREDIKDENELEMLCKDICSNACSYQLDEDHHLTISIGAILFTGKIDYEKIYEASDQTLYKVKGAGRNNYIIDSIE